MRLQWFAAVLLSWIMVVPASVAVPQTQPVTRVIDREGRPVEWEVLVARLAASRVVFIGETHDRYDEHLSQLEVIRRLHERAPKRWVLGVEYFQRRFQPFVDAFIAGSITEREFLAKTEYFDRWGFDYRLYRPIFQYAKAEGIPLVALNAEHELTEKVGKVGLAGLSSADRASLPRDIDKSDQSYRARLQEVFKEHSETNDFEHFIEVQLTWDETMAQTAAAFLADHPDRGMIILAGSEHIAFGSGIPNRLQRRLPDAPIVMLQAADTIGDAKGAAYILPSTNISLPPAGRMGIVMDQTNGIAAKEVAEGGAAAQAGIKPKDRIMAIDDTKIQTLGDVRLALLEKAPGDRVTLRVSRETAGGAAQDMTFQLTLQK